MIRNLVLLFFLLNSTVCLSQVDLNLILNHKFNGDPFLYSQNYQDENGNAINISRLQYYISSIEITHDSGINTPLSSVYVLANGNVANYFLGQYPIYNIEKLEFDLGVDYDANHGNSSNYSSQHPLGPQSPLMDWGWPAGYFFLVIDGTIDDNGDGVPNKAFQLRSLGDVMLQDVNYLTNTYESINNIINLSLDVNIDRWLNGIDLINAGIDHSSSSTNLNMCNNTVTNQVFEANDLSSLDSQQNLIDITTDYNLSYSPTINYKLNNNIDFTLSIYNSSGQIVLQSQSIGFEGNYFIRKELKSGVYFAFFNGGKYTYKHKFIIN